mgnify:CR=1 FL=1
MNNNLENSINDLSNSSSHSLYTVDENKSIIVDEEYGMELILDDIEEIIDIAGKNYKSIFVEIKNWDFS